MSEPINNGGAAFPGIVGEEGRGNLTQVFTPDGRNLFIEHAAGMTLRDWFAGRETLSDWDHSDAIIPKWLAEALTGEKKPENTEDKLATCVFEAKWRAALRYLRADAMISARNKPTT